MKSSNNFTQGGLLFPLLRFAGPILAALFLQTMYGAVDMLVVGRFAGPGDVSAVSTGSFLMHLITSFVVGVSMGTTVLLGHRLGEGKSKEAGKIIGASIVLFSVIGVVMTLVMELFAVPLAQIMHAPPEAFDATVSYVRICSVGCIFIVAYNVLGSIFRGMGNSRMPLLTVAIACVFNIIGDFLLVGVFHMATAGAAIATIAAQALSVIISLLIIRRQKLPFTLTGAHLRRNLTQMGSIFRLGFPIALQDVLVSISFLTITAIVNSLGVITSAGVGVAEKLCGFIMLVPSAFSQSMAAVVSQNIGAAQPARAKRALFYGIASSLSVSIVVAYFAFFHGDIMASLFARDAEVIAVAADYLRAYAIDCLLTAELFCLIGYFSGCGHTTFVMIQGIAGAFLVRIPVSFLMSQQVPASPFRIGLATPCSSLVQIAMFAFFFLYINRKKHVDPSKNASHAG